MGRMADAESIISVTSSGSYGMGGSSKSDTSTGKTLMVATAEDNLNSPDKAKNANTSGYLPELPSDRFSQTNWNDLRRAVVTGDRLRAPRVRRAPDPRDRQRKPTPMEALEPITTIKTPSRKNPKIKRYDYRNSLENWENVTHVNLSFQDLGHGYQRENFTRILHRLLRTQHLQLMDNSLDDLSKVSLPGCTHLWVQRNFLDSFKKLPKIPNIKFLQLSENGIESLSGLRKVIGKSSIEYLVLKGNPVELQENYRIEVFQAIPSLKILDGIPKLPSDEPLDPNATNNGQSTACIIS
ncbi:Dynein light chain 1, axonemal [Trichoplax sp. H2]|uniref:Dynein assembly factor 1, axonemal homolog n=1 Tax=Trichoplax adhaerens TaxID=10228 RepID=B3RZS2_TRIAD|nr:hypothetical protein TRIADDRAFT_57557 [Trichoplax adhaerens]EDV23889.1 hypothetical protein TRIADDRAFT_57557 [Trichoplax adhaerens]RDD44082.1 Dynein light chain 1, axonemal [Trichoplax sp. H2]|eukprot:XP_002113415.1 hypothetical protein TRIADDRAFT_57557 [Trichoplax adhaerens]